MNLLYPAVSSDDRSFDWDAVMANLDNDLLATLRSPAERRLFREPRARDHGLPHQRVHAVLEAVHARKNAYVATFARLALDPYIKGEQVLDVPLRIYMSLNRSEVERPIEFLQAALVTVSDLVVDQFAIPLMRPPRTGTFVEFMRRAQDTRNDVDSIDHAYLTACAQYERQGGVLMTNEREFRKNLARFVHHENPDVWALDGAMAKPMRITADTTVRVWDEFIRDRRRAGIETPADKS